MTRGCQVLAGATIVGGLCAGLVAQQPAPSFRSSVDAVSVPVSVTDRNRPVTRLTAADFDLRDNGVAQVITAAPVESLSVDVTLVLDASGSVKGPALEQFKTDVQDIAESMQTNDRVRSSPSRPVSPMFRLQTGGARLPVERIEAGGAMF